jgi:hypothetical protein
MLMQCCGFRKCRAKISCSGIKVTGEIPAGRIEGHPPDALAARQYNPKRVVRLSWSRWDIGWEIRGWICKEQYGSAPSSS